MVRNLVHFFSACTVQIYAFFSPFYLKQSSYFTAAEEFKTFNLIFWKLKKAKTVWIHFLQDQKSDTFWFEHFAKFISFKHCLACKLKWSNREVLAFFSPFYLQQSSYFTAAEEFKTFNLIICKLKKAKTAWIHFLQDQKLDIFWFEHFDKSDTI